MTLTSLMVSGGSPLVRVASFSCAAAVITGAANRLFKRLRRFTESSYRRRSKGSHTVNALRSRFMILRGLVHGVHAAQQIGQAHIGPELSGGGAPAAGR